jgi:hypothetical protein
MTEAFETTSYDAIGGSHLKMVHILLVVAFCWSMFASTIALTRTERGNVEGEFTSRLSFHSPGIAHPMSCAISRKMKYACDIDTETGKIRSVANWTLDSDPWNSDTKPGVDDMTLRSGHWTCPSDWVSQSGCGDMRSLPDITFCNNAVVPRCSESSQTMYLSQTLPLVPQYHVPVAYPIFYDDFDTTGRAGKPPVIGRHREAWPAWGEYAFLPPQRWLHAAEHGGLVFLFNPCIRTETVDELRSAIRAFGAAHASPFRYVLTPFSNLSTSYAVVSWGKGMLFDCMDGDRFSSFLKENYRNAWEDLPTLGRYDLLRISDSLRNNSS